MGIRIDNLPATAVPTPAHELPAMADGLSVKLTIAQILGLIEAGDIEPIVKDVLAAAVADNTVDDADTVLYLTGDDAKKATLTGLISSIFKTARTIANAQFAAATFKLFNTAGTPRALTFVTTALTADRKITMPNADVDLSLVAPADVKAWVNFNGTGTVAIRASKNVSSITDNGTGDYTVNFAAAMADTNYAIMGSANALVLDDGGAAAAPKTTTSCRFSTTNVTAARIDASNVSIAIMR